MKLLLTGASGFIGRNVLLRAPRDWEIVAVYNRTGDLPAFVAAHGLAHVAPVACDLVSADAVRALAARIGRADAALYLAANGDPAASVERVRWDLELNTVAVVNVLENGVTGLPFMSLNPLTPTVYAVPGVSVAESA